MRIEIKKRADGAGLLRCTRDDGTVTWQKQSERAAAHFSLHDLTHHAVESVLGTRRGFFGLVNSGWEIEDTTGKGARGPLPLEAGEVEMIVGLFDSERACRTQWTLDHFHQYGGGLGQRLTPDDLAAVRQLRSDLFARWAETGIDQILELRF